MDLRRHRQPGYADVMSRRHGQLVAAPPVVGGTTLGFKDRRERRTSSKPHNMARGPQPASALARRRHLAETVHDPRGRLSCIEMTHRRERWSTIPKAQTFWGSMARGERSTLVCTSQKGNHLCLRPQTLTNSPSSTNRMARRENSNTGISNGRISCAWPIACIVEEHEPEHYKTKRDRHLSIAGLPGGWPPQRTAAPTLGSSRETG